MGCPLMNGIPLMAWDWNVFPRGDQEKSESGSYDAIIIGAGLGGLSCAAAFARQGFKPLVLEQKYIPGGYATSFERPGGFTFDVSLHSTTVGLRNGIPNLISGFPEIQDITFVPHKTLYRTIYPEHDIRVPHRDVPGYIKILQNHFPEEKEGIKGLFADIEGLTEDLNKYQSSGGQVDMSTFPQEFPFLFKNFNRTWGAMVDERIQDPKLKTIVSSLWGYFGLPPSKLSTFYYAMPLLGYLEEGGYYPIGTSQKISNAFASLIKNKGGEIKCNTRVTKILTKDHAAYGVRTGDGKEYRGKFVISNANSVDTFTKMLDEKEHLKSYLKRMDSFSVSTSTFQIWLGLKKDYDHWKTFETDYFQGKKDVYNKEKERITGILIDKVEETLLPGLKDAIEVKVAATPLTNVRFTSNYRGAIYGWDQTLENSGNRRVDHRTPIKNLYLSGAWTYPGGGYGACIPSGLICFSKVMEDLEKKNP